MKSPYNKIMVFDLETGGFYSKYNSITEIAMVAVDLESLEIVDELSIMLRPYLNLRNREIDPIKEAKAIFKSIATKDEETNIKTLHYKGQSITLKNLAILEEDIANFFIIYENRKTKSPIIMYDEFLELQKNEEIRDILNVYFDYCYNPQALESTNISKELLLDEGKGYEESFGKIKRMIEKHTHGNSKPIMAGHNIGSLPRRISKKKEVPPNGFDNPFMEVLFEENMEDYFDMVNDKFIDTLEEARLKWYELPNYQLGTCANAVDITLSGAHRALADTTVNANLLIKMLKSLRGEGSQQSTYKRRKFDFNF